MRRYHNSSSKYFEYKIHSNEDKEVRDYTQIISIDPAQKNFTIRIESRYPDKVFTVYFRRINLEVDEIFESSLLALSNELDVIKEYILNCDFVFIEKQLPDNYKAVRICQHALTYLITILKNNDRRTRIFEVNSKTKNIILNPPKGTNAKEIKKLSIIKGKELLSRRKDEFALEVLQDNKKKQDDLCDTICQIEAMLVELNISDNL